MNIYIIAENNTDDSIALKFNYRNKMCVFVCII